MSALYVYFKSRSHHFIKNSLDPERRSASVPIRFRGKRYETALAGPARMGHIPLCGRHDLLAEGMKDGPPLFVKNSPRRYLPKTCAAFPGRRRPRLRRKRPVCPKTRNAGKRRTRKKPPAARAPGAFAHLVRRLSHAAGAVRLFHGREPIVPQRPEWPGTWSFSPQA